MYPADRDILFGLSKGETFLGVIEVDMFEEDIDSTEHPVAESFRELLEEVAEGYKCRLLSFEVAHGTVSFSFDSDELTAEILKILQIGPGKGV